MMPDKILLEDETGYAWWIYAIAFNAVLSFVCVLIATSFVVFTGVVVVATGVVNTFEGFIILDMVLSGLLYLMCLFSYNNFVFR